MLALAYLESRFAFHHARAVLRSPLRLAIWLPYLVSIACVAYARVATPHHQPFLRIGLPGSFVTAAGGLYLGTLGITIGFAAGGRVAAFRSAAEAVLFVNSGVRPIAIAVWMQLRKIAASWSRWISGLVYVFLIAVPAHAGASVVLRVFAAALLALAVHIGCELPTFLLARGRLKQPVRVAGWALAGAGFICAAGTLFGSRFLGPLAAAGLDPGAGVRAVLAGAPAAIAVFALIFAVFVTSIGLLGGDALPELYEAFTRSNAHPMRRPRGTSLAGFNADASVRNPRIPSGALALTWKDWVAFRRGCGVVALWVAGCVFWTLCGAGAALAGAAWSDSTPIVTLAVASALMVLLGASFGAARGLASDLAKPLFWLSRASLRSRIAAWTLGRAWRGGLAIGLAPLAAGIVSGDLPLALGALPLSLASYWSLQCLGVGLLAVFPHQVDARGPVLLIRLLLTALYVAPPLLFSTLAGLVNEPLGAFTFALTLVVEGALVIELASHRFREHGAQLGAANAQ